MINKLIDIVAWFIVKHDALYCRFFHERESVIVTGSKRTVEIIYCKKCQELVDSKYV